MPDKWAADREVRYHIIGWVLFVVCALFFMAAAWANGDWLTLIGSIIFLFACVVFLIPLLASAHDEKE